MCSFKEAVRGHLKGAACTATTGMPNGAQLQEDCRKKTPKVAENPAPTPWPPFGTQLPWLPPKLISAKSYSTMTFRN